VVSADQLAKASREEDRLCAIEPSGEAGIDIKRHLADHVAAVEAIEALRPGERWPNHELAAQDDEPGSKRFV